MADQIPLFYNLDDGSDGGVARRKVLEGDAAAAKNAAASLVAKDSNGDLIYLRTDASGNLLTSNEGAANCVGGHLAVTAGNTSRTQVGCDAALIAGKALSSLEWSLSNFRSTIYEIVIVDDPAGTPVETPILDVICAEGDMTDFGRMICLEDISTTGMTDPVLRVYGTNKNVASDFRGRVTVQEAL